MQRSFVIGGTQVAARPLDPALYLVATPIGNLGDITLRALETLAACDLLACEDTRVTRVLLDRYGISRKPVAYHEHNAAEAGPKLIAALEAGQSVALVSDAGTPLVSDPGFRLVGQAVAAGIRVISVPGASAVLTALTASGLPSDAFLFAGFLPVKGGQRRARLEALKTVPATLVFFKSPRRLADYACRDGGCSRRSAGGGRSRADQGVRGDAARFACLAGRALCAGADTQGRDRCLRRPAGRRNRPCRGGRGSPSVIVSRRNAGLEGCRRGRAHDRPGEALALSPPARAAGRVRVRDQAERREAYRRGHRGEWLAAAALLVKGFRIVARRYRTRLGEIDLIARRGNLVLIVEVKVRPTLAEAMEAIARESEWRIEGAADLWLARQPDFSRLSMRFDMVAVLPRRWPVHVQNVFYGRN